MASSSPHSGKVPAEVRRDFSCGCILIRGEILILCLSHQQRLPEIIKR